MGTAIEIQNIGPIESQKIECPEDGGVVVLRGPNGSGKSTAIEAVQAINGGRADGLSTRDGQKSGAVSFGSVSM